MARLVTRLVTLAYRHAAAVALIALLVTVGAGYYAATHLDLDTDIEQLLPRDTTWRQQ